jgi:hypothetical protein
MHDLDLICIIRIKRLNLLKQGQNKRELPDNVCLFAALGDLQMGPDIRGANIPPQRVHFVDATDGEIFLNSQFFNLLEDILQNFTRADFPRFVGVFIDCLRGVEEVRLL